MTDLAVAVVVVGVVNIGAQYFEEVEDEVEVATAEMLRRVGR